MQGTLCCRALPIHNGLLYGPQQSFKPYHYHPGSQELYMSEPQIRFFDEEGHSVQLCAKLQPSAPAQWPYMQWLAWPGACCLHRPAADSHREICQELPAILTMSRAPAATQMQELVIKISQQLPERIRGCRTFPNVEADRAAFAERFAAIVSLYEEKHRRTIEDWFGLRAQLILAFWKQPPRHQ